MAEKANGKHSDYHHDYLQTLKQPQSGAQMQSNNNTYSNNRVWVVYGKRIWRFWLRFHQARTAPKFSTAFELSTSALILSYKLSMKRVNT
jgi:serine kinase of HPr protein (carbohydrate metabolism regulator)